MNDDELDPQIELAYRRLGTALAPPPDVAVRVVRLAGARRRRRRVAAAGVACAVAAGAVGGAVVLGGADPENDNAVAVDPGGPTGSFVLTRPDGSTYEMSDLTLTCDAPPEAGYQAGRPQRIWLMSPSDISADGKVLGSPFVYFTGIVDKLDGQTFQLPVDGSDSDHIALTLFAADPDVAPTEERANEVSSAEYGSTGTIVVARASCDPTPVLDLEVDVTLGSEVQQGTLDLAGSFR
jgi:hypothetical protein